MTTSSVSALELNSRETALLIWLLTAVIYATIEPNLRKPLYSALKILARPKIACVIVFSMTYCIIEILCLSLVGVWSSENIKTTAFWYLGYACLSVFQFEKIEKEPEFFRTTIRNSFTTLAVIQFITGLYTLNLVVELVLLPVLFLLSAILAISQANGKLSGVSAAAPSLLAALGILIFTYSIYKAFSDYESILTIAKAADLVVPSLLTIGFLPFLFLLHLYASYESCFISIQFLIKNKALLPHARSSAIKSFKLKTKYLKRWQNQLAVDRPESTNEIDKTTNTVLHADSIINLRRTPYTHQGWHPSKATKFLANHGLPQDFYHPIQDGTWTASSPYKKFRGKIFSDDVAYYTFGTESVVHLLQVSLSVNDPDDTGKSTEEFINICKLLHWKSIRSRMSVEHVEKIRRREAFDSETETTAMSFEIDTWENSTRKGYAMVLRIRSLHAPKDFNLF